MGGCSGVSRLADVADGLADKAVGGWAYVHFLAGEISVGMDHHAHVYIVKSSLVNEVSLAGKEVNFSFFDEALAIGKLHIFFGGDGHENSIAGKLVHDSGFHYTGHGGQQTGYLQIVTAGVSSTGLRVSLGAVHANYSVQLAKDGDTGAGCFSLHPGFHAGDSQMLCRLCA